MGYANIFQKLEQDIANQLKTLEAKQKQLVEKQKVLVNTRAKIQTFLNSAEEIKKAIEKEPELMKSVRSELGQIFNLSTINYNPSPAQPKLLITKEESLTPNLEELMTETKTDQSQEQNSSQNSEVEEDEDEIIKDFKFVDAHGNNKSK